MAIHRRSSAREHAIHDLLTLNFDLAVRHALVDMNAGAEVGVSQRARRRVPSRGVHAVCLHVTPRPPPDEWILRTFSDRGRLEERWEAL